MVLDLMDFFFSFLGFFQSGLETINSTNFFSIPVSDIANLPYTSNVNVKGRWVFRVDIPSENNSIYLFL